MGGIWFDEDGEDVVDDVDDAKLATSEVLCVDVWVCSERSEKETKQIGHIQTRIPTHGAALRTRRQPPSSGIEAS